MEIVFPNNLKIAIVVQTIYHIYIIHMQGFYLQCHLPW